LGCRDQKYQEIKNVIVYAGRHHINYYDKFLEKYFDVTPTIKIINDEDNKCMEFSKPFDFLIKIRFICNIIVFNNDTNLFRSKYSINICLLIGEKMSLFSYKQIILSNDRYINNLITIKILHYKLFDL